MNSVQFYIAKWNDFNQFAKDFTTCEAVYGRMPTQLEIERAYARYVKLAVARDD